MEVRPNRILLTPGPWQLRPQYFLCVVPSWHSATNSGRSTKCRGLSQETLDHESSFRTRVLYWKWPLHKIVYYQPPSAKCAFIPWHDRQSGSGEQFHTMRTLGCYRQLRQEDGLKESISSLIISACHLCPSFPWFSENLIINKQFHHIVPRNHNYDNADFMFFHLQRPPFVTFPFYSHVLGFCYKSHFSFSIVNFLTYP